MCNWKENCRGSRKAGSLGAKYREAGSESELPENALSEGEAPESELSENVLPEGEVPESELPENVLPEGEAPESELPGSGARKAKHRRK